MRQLKYHEQKLLKKVDFYNWKREHDLHEVKVMRRYHIQKREDYVKCDLFCQILFSCRISHHPPTRYNKLVGSVQKLSAMIQKLDPKDPFRMEITEQFLNKLYVCFFVFLFNKC
jgi:U3 small nucleolar ribonucleoprotein protein IMP3